MLKKLIIAAVAVIAGLVVLNQSSLVKTYWSKFCHSAKRMVPPERRLEQLNIEIANIDKDIKKNLSRLAAMEVEANMFEDRLNEARKEQAHVRADITDMRKALEAGGEKVVFRTSPISASRLTDRLEIAVTKFTGLKERIKAQEKILKNKRHTIEVAHKRISDMKDAQEKLRNTSSELENHLEMVRLKQVQNQDLTIDDSGALSKAIDIAKDVEIQLRTAEKEMELQAQFGYADKVPEEKPSRNREEVLKSARQALEEDSKLAANATEKDE
jgi:predicted  nucleic acid-binding Zn-ribbon protein